MEWDPEGRLRILTALIYWIAWLGVMGIVAVVLLARDADNAYGGIHAPDVEEVATVPP